MTRDFLLTDPLVGKINKMSVFKKNSFNHCDFASCVRRQREKFPQRGFLRKLGVGVDNDDVDDQRAA